VSEQKKSKYELEKQQQCLVK